MSTSPSPSAEISAPQRVLLTGGSGYLGRFLTARLRSQFSLRVLDVVADIPEVEGRPVDFVQGSVADTALVERAVEGMDALVIAHMAPNQKDTYATVDMPFSINVQGTAALLLAAARRNIRRVVLISSTSVVDRSRRDGSRLTVSSPTGPTVLYGLTKSLQEQTARFFHENYGMEIAVLRPAYVITETPLADKYGRSPGSVNWQFIDPEDIAEAAALALTAPGITFDIFYTVAGPGAEERVDLGPIRERLGWEPKHRFSQYPLD